ncbi:SDR family oxidoreductase [Nocardiopsis tropica]|jgi:NAD(P)-dependent dehydrogenase (short-subunit alcohol dehydrogenase family)|uniref:SDR family oxidoreductase n=1 Tax=Nocardiopsis tropica TaxID=109330 RepID=A0ABU7KXA6_9ACTN|nr:SDR family oxidoreductase [Nocardiopsis umidischolae]MEE2053946.1 SDR family oxidoreductase [Nocardiopsis umidischolae]
MEQRRDDARVDGVREFDGYDRVAVVTGADSGIGRSTAVRLAREGFDLGITYHSDEEGIRRTESEIGEAGRRAVVRRHDLSDPVAGSEAVAELIGELGGVGVLVNNAGTGSDEPLLETDYERWREVLAVDLDGPFLCSRIAATHMRDAGRGGRIVNITSVHEEFPRVNAGAYCAAKGGLKLLTRVLALELGLYGITVNAVAPGEIATPMTGQHEEPPGLDTRGGYPIPRPGHADEVADAVAFLAGRGSSYVTGASLFVDGGLSLMGPQAGGALQDGTWRAG